MVREKSEEKGVDGRKAGSPEPVWLRLSG